MQMITLFLMQIKISKLLNNTWKWKAEKCIWLFAINCMKANLDKFLAILLNCESEGSHCLNVNGCSIEPSEEVTLLGVRQSASF